MEENRTELERLRELLNTAKEWADAFNRLRKYHGVPSMQFYEASHKLFDKVADLKDL